MHSEGAKKLSSRYNTEEPKIDFCSLLNTLTDNAETAHEPSLESRGIDNTRIAGFHPLHEF